MKVEELPAVVGEWKLEQVTDDLVSYVAEVTYSSRKWLAYAEAHRRKFRGGKAIWILAGYARPSPGKEFIEYELYRPRSAWKEAVLDALVEWIRDNKTEEEIVDRMRGGYMT